MPPAQNTLKKCATWRETRRSIILDAAVDLFARKSFKQVSMRDIAKQAGMFPASFYRYFKDQDHLFVEALFREATAIAANLSQRIESGQKVGLEEIAANFVEYLLDHEALFRMMTHFMVDGGISQKALACFNETERRLLDAFEERFAKYGADLHC